MSREIKPQVYYYARRGWYDHLVRFCDSVMTKKGKDPASMYWKAFALGMSGYISESLKILEAFQSRKDMQYAVNAALMYFHKRTPNPDKGSIQTLKSEQTIAEEVTASVTTNAFVLV